MISPRWRKVFKDITSNKSRTTLVMLTIAVGVFAVGFVTISFVRILNDMDADYQSVNPHSAIVYADPFDDDLLASLVKVPGVAQVEGRSAASGKVLLSNGKEFNIGITAIPPLDKMKIDQLRPSKTGAVSTLGLHQIWLEGSSQAAAPFKIGDMVTVQITDKLVRQLQMAGYVHDVTNIPYVFSNQLIGFVNQDTMNWLGQGQDYNQAYLTVAQDKKNETHVQAVAADVAKKIEDSGRKVYFTLVFQPGRHFASDITKSLGVMMGFLGGLAVVLSAFLVFNTINALMSQQVRHIGVMKAVGGQASQIMGMYLLLVVCYGLLAMLVAVPLAYLAANAVCSGISQYLNFTPGKAYIPMISWVAMAFVALLVPLIAALLPVLHAARMTVREAISSYGLGTGRFGKGLVDRLLENIRGLPRPLLISLRNTFRRKGRLVLTLSTLTLAGAIFIAVFNLRASMSIAIHETLGYFLSDINVGFNQVYRLERVQPLTAGIPHLVSLEGWGGAIGKLLSPDKKTSTQISISAPPSGSNLIKPTITSGRWLVPGDQNALVIGNHLLAVRPDLKVGDKVVININDKESSWEIVGTFRLAGNVVPPPVFASADYLDKVMGITGQVAEIRVVTDQHDLATQQQVGQQLQDIFKKNGIQVSQVVTGAQRIAQNTQSTDILVYFLLVMAVLIALVGGLGLMSTMSMNVIERVREIGVMRAIGASNLAIQQLVLVEGLLIGTISWILGAFLAIPIGRILAGIVGVAFLRSPLPFVFSWDGLVVWLIIVLVISSLASSLPARNASRLTVREVLAYE